MNQRAVAATDYLAAVTRILQQARLDDPTGGLWEAADVHWAWRADRHEDPDEQRVWFDGDEPVAAAAFTRWTDTWGADVFGRPDVTAGLADDLWGFLGSRHTDEPVEMMLGEADEVGQARARAGGFGAQETPLRTSWLDAAGRPPVVEPPAGYTLTSYDGGPHWLASRNGDEVAERLSESSLHRNDLDLAIAHGDGDEMAGYAVFWADPVTGVGLVEPMRVEDEHSGGGLARCLLTGGLERLAAAGCTRMKVSFDPANTAAARLYLGAGFLPVSRERLWRRTPGI